MNVCSLMMKWITSFILKMIRNIFSQRKKQKYSEGNDSSQENVRKQKLISYQKYDFWKIYGMYYEVFILLHIHLPV